MRRFTSSFRCPICGGHEGLARGQGRRCSGFLSDDGRFARCSREERAGALEPESKTGLFVHYLAGACRCGVRHGEGPVEPLSARAQEHEIETALRNQKAGLRIWSWSKPIAGTLGELYLVARGITLTPGPDELRFHPALRYALTRQCLPAIVAPFHNPAGKIVAIDRIFLKADGSGKADIADPKRMLGPVRGAAIRFGGIGPEIRLAEGVENALTLREMLGSPAWAAGSATGLRQVELLPVVRKLVIYADNDDGGVGVEAACNAARRFIREGRDARVVIPPRGTDVNDLLHDEIEGGARGG